MSYTEVSSFDTLREFIEEERKSEGNCDYIIVLSNERCILIRKTGGKLKVVIPELGEYEFKSVSYKSPNWLKLGNLSVYCDNPDTIRVEKDFKVKSATNRIVYNNKLNVGNPRVRLSKSTSFVYNLDPSLSWTL